MGLTNRGLLFVIIQNVLILSCTSRRNIFRSLGFPLRGISNDFCLFVITYEILILSCTSRINVFRSLVFPIRNILLLILKYFSASVPIPLYLLPGLHRTYNSIFSVVNNVYD